MIEEYLKKAQKLIQREDIVFEVGYNSGYSKLEKHHLHFVKDHSTGLTIRLIKSNHTNNDPEIARFTLQQLAGCCGIAVSTGAYVNGKYRRLGLGKLLNQFRQEICISQDYTVMLCTDKENNEPQKKILDKAGFEHIYKFKNKRTNNILNISVLLLDKNYKV